MVKGTDYEHNFDEGHASEGWYRGFLRIHNFLTRAERPLEMTRHEWLALGNLETYFDVCAEVFVKAGVARVNLDYDPNGEPISIDKPHLISSFNETKVALYSTTTSKGKQHCLLCAGVENDGECFVTRSSSCATFVCGRLGTREALPPYIVFASGNTYHPARAPQFCQISRTRAASKWRGATQATRKAVSTRRVLLTT
jgi:hypothetical protein